MVAVVGGQSAQPVRGQELVIIEKLAEYLLEAVGADDAQQQMPVAARTADQVLIAELVGVGQAAPASARLPGLTAGSAASSGGSASGA